MTLRRPTLVCLLLAAVACAAQEPDPPPAPDLDAARAEVLAAEDAINLAVDATDCAAGMAWLGEGDPLFVSGGMVVRTRDELSSMCEQMVEPRTGAVFDVDSRTARMLSDSAALVVREGTYTINFKDGTSREIFLVMTSVWERDADGWRMIHLHESMPMPEGGPPS